MQTAESSNAALTGSITLPVPVQVIPPVPCELDADPASSDTNKKKSSNKPEEQEAEKTNKGIANQQRRYIRARLTRDLWEEYQKPGITTAEKIKLGGLLSRLTDKRKAAPKPIFS